jgi:hypothetical protein
MLNYCKTLVASSRLTQTHTHIARLR